MALACCWPAAVLAQEPPEIPSSATEPRGFIAEPEAITRTVLWADRHLGKGDLTNGIYVDHGNLIPGAGWISVGPGYRQWFDNDRVFVDASGSFSINSYRMVQARAELPKLLKSRLAVGSQVRWQDFGRVDYFGAGIDSQKGERSKYAIESTQLTAYASLRFSPWVHLDVQTGWMNPETEYGGGPLLIGLADKRTFVPTEASLTVDTRDFPDHPTSGILLRGGGTHFDDRTTGLNTFDRYEGEAAGFVPIAGGRVVLALHGWLVTTEMEPGRSVPFYLQPTLGGAKSLRSYLDYRFRDDHMLMANAEVRLTLMTHLDLAMFADAGNVAARRSDLDLARRSYGAGVRLHTRRQTFAMLDVARGDEGWRFLLRVTDPLALSRLSKKPTLVPFVP